MIDREEHYKITAMMRGVRDKFFGGTTETEVYWHMDFQVQLGPYEKHRLPDELQTETAVRNFAETLYAENEIVKSIRVEKHGMHTIFEIGT